MQEKHFIFRGMYNLGSLIW